MESMSVLLYLLKEHDKNDTFGFKDDLERNECLQVDPSLCRCSGSRVQWMAWIVGGIGPMQGQCAYMLCPLSLTSIDNHFNRFAKDKLPCA